MGLGFISGCACTECTFEALRHVFFERVYFTGLVFRTFLVRCDVNLVILAVARAHESARAILMPAAYTF